jgi:hypothetical protein
MFQTWSKLLKLVVTKGNIVSDVALVTCHIESFLELILGLIVFLFLIEHASLRHNSFWSVSGHLSNKGFGVLDLFKFILNSDLQLKNFLSVVGIFNLLNNLSCFIVKSSFEERLSVVKLV